MRLFIVFLLFSFITSCGGKGQKEDDNYHGVWVSGCTSSFLAMGSVDYPIYLSFIETLEITNENVSSRFQIFQDQNCEILDEGLTSLNPDWGGEVMEVKELTSDNGYPYKSYKTSNADVGENYTNVSYIDGLLYKVHLDYSVFESNGHQEHNVIFGWHFQKQ